MMLRMCFLVRPITHQQHHCSVVNALRTDPEEKTMNKVVIFVIFGPKCIFDASTNSN